MKIEALNCPNCGAAVSDESNSCEHCKSRLKTKSCPNCFETVFEGSVFCPLCGAKAVLTDIAEAGEASDCPRCRGTLVPIEVAEVMLDECDRCSGVWCDVQTFEDICSEKERRSAVITRLGAAPSVPGESKIRYLPCPVCRRLMNRSNFARVSGIIIDTCRPHGLWFDSRELSAIIEFISKGGMDLAREKEKRQIAEERDRLKQEKFTAAVDRFKNDNGTSFRRTGTASGIHEFIKFLFD